MPILRNNASTPRPSLLTNPVFLALLLLIVLSLAALGYFFRGDLHLLAHDTRALISGQGGTNVPPAPPAQGEVPPPANVSPVQPEVTTDAINPQTGLFRPPNGPTMPVSVLLQQAFVLLEQKQTDAALDKLNAVLQEDPRNEDAYGLRGSIYAGRKLWDQAMKDYQTALQIDGKNNRIKFDLAEMDFMQKNYDAARPGFAALQNDSDMGDLAAYKVFLCDLLGGHEDVASKELDAFNEVGSNASYYFANLAWSIYHQKMDDARGWLKSAANIYAPQKFQLYATSLIELGYLPLPPPPPSVLFSA